MSAKTTEQRYGPTSGTLSGWAGLVFCAAVVVALLLGGPDLVRVRWTIAVLAVGVAIWAVMLRPLIIVRAPVVELRNPFSSWLVPLATIDLVVVRVITRIEAGGRTYDAVAVGRRIRKMVSREQRDPISESRTKRIDASTPETLADLMTGQILAAAENARRSGQDAGPAVRVWAVPELAVLAALVVALVVTLLL